MSAKGRKRQALHHRRGDSFGLEAAPNRDACIGRRAGLRCAWRERPGYAGSNLCKVDVKMQESTSLPGHSEVLPEVRTVTEATI
jgi:hypothetical protein